MLVAIDFFYNFDNSSYSKNCASAIYFVCYMLYCCNMYFKFGLSFYMFAIIFRIRRRVKVERKKINGDKYFDTEGALNILRECNPSMHVHKSLCPHDIADCDIFPSPSVSNCISFRYFYIHNLYCVYT
jgi:hypothetical protein